MAHSSPRAHWVSSPAANRSSGSTAAHGSWMCPNASPVRTTAARRPQARRPVQPRPALHPAAKRPGRQSPPPAREDQLLQPSRFWQNCHRASLYRRCRESAESGRAPAQAQAAAVAALPWCGRETLPAEMSSPSHRAPNAAPRLETSSKSSDRATTPRSARSPARGLDSPRPAGWLARPAQSCLLYTSRCV